MAINYVPRGDRVIVKQLELPEREMDGVYLPDSQRKRPDEGIVIAVGVEVKDLKPGDHICYLEFAGQTIEVDGVGYLSMRAQEIHGVRSTLGK